MLPQVEELATLVVCEDDEPTRELLCDHLTADRYRALSAPSASDALRLCGYNSPDLMVLDLVLPDAAGIDVLRQIRSAEGASDRFDPQLPVIVLSGRGANEDRVRGFAEGADDYVVKAIRCPLQWIGAAHAHALAFRAEEARAQRGRLWRRGAFVRGRNGSGTTAPGRGRADGSAQPFFMQ